jgi:hypothetical protein
MTTMAATTTQVYQVFIQATPEQIWDAITKPEFTARYFHGARIETTRDRRQAFGPNGELWGDEATTAASVSGPGWMYVLSNLKTLLETGQPLPS